MYSRLENDAGDAYPGNATAGTAWEKCEGSHHNMKMVRYIEEKEDADRSNLIQIGVFKLTSRNATKRLKIWQETHAPKNFEADFEANSNPGVLS